jgi:hypothetical protein
MSAFEKAKQFFDNLEALKGWGECKEYVADGAPFACQSDPLGDVRTVEDYCDWLTGFGKVTVAGATYDLHAASWDEATRTATFFATYHAKHTGEGGPVPPTNKETHSHYVYALTMNSDDKVQSMIKIWNGPWAMKELGWA